MDTVNISTFVELTGISDRDKFVLEKKYTRVVYKTIDQWYDLLTNEFDIPVDLRTKEINSEKEEVISKSKKILQDIKKEKSIDNE